MTAVELLSHPLAQRLTWTLAHFVWQGLLIAAVLALIVELLRPRSIHVRYALSLGALICMLAVVPLTWFIVGENDAAFTNPVGITSIELSHSSDEVPASETAVTTASWWLVAQPCLFCCWLAGCTLLSFRLLVGWLATQSLLRGRIALPREVAAQLAKVGWRLQTSIPRVVFASEQVTQAIAVGFIRPIVLLPSAWLLELPPNLLEAVVAHEIAHLRRRDLWVNFLQRIAEALLFYHPAIWWLSARLRRERELCCDQLAVSATGERLHYAEALEFTARWAAVDGRPALAAGFFGEGKMNLLHRVRCVLGMSHERPASLWSASLLLGSLSFALLAAIYAVNTVNADDERPAAKREGDRPREGEVRRDGDRPREGEVRRDGDRPREGEVRRDGDRPREGEVRRDGDRPRPEGAPRDGERRPDARPDARRPEGAPREGEVRRPAAGGGENAELMAIIRQLRAEVSELRAEVARLKGGDLNRRPAAGVEPRREGDRPRPDAERREGADRPREGADRPREGADRPRAEGERREGGERPKEGERK